jgi:hypothetical protein
MGKKTGKEPLERPISRRGDSIETYLRMESVGCINMARVECMAGTGGDGKFHKSRAIS